jgi:mannosyltransferase OCH1-like enzyme
MNIIPKNIFQTHKSMKYIKSKPKIYNAMNSWKIYTNEFNYYFFNDIMCEDFIKNNFDENVYKAYSMLPMAVMKADLWRYCIIYKYGGIYADTDTICKINPNIFINNSLLTVSQEPAHNYFCQWVFAAPANSPVLKTIIDLSVERILNNPIKGEHIIHFLTGPALFSDGIELYLKNNNKPTFKNLINYLNYSDPTLRVFNRDNFHKNVVQHLYAGSDDDGWKQERYSKLI